MSRDTRIVLFDLGGVLADLGDPASEMRLDFESDQFWKIWLHSPSVRAFELGRSPLVSFGEPYRAAAFVNGLERRAPTLNLDWFRKGVGKFVVVLLYEDRDQFRESAAVLARAGFPLP